MSNYIIVDLLRKIFNEVQQSSSNEQYKVNCPSCAKIYNDYDSDGKFNLEINTFKRVYKCWKCGISGKLINLFKYYGNTEIYNFYLDNFDFSFDEFFVEDSSQELFDIELPKEYIPFSDFNEDNPEHLPAYNYMTGERKISLSKLIKYNVGFCVKGKFKNRIIFPSYDNNNELNYFVSRTYLKIKPTYLNPKVSKDIIFYENLIDWNVTLYIVEGVIDFFAVPINTLILNGKGLNFLMLENIKKFKPPIVLLIDGDALKDSLKIMDTLENNSIEKVEFVFLEKEFDIDQLRVNFGKNYISSYIKNNKKILNDVDKLWLSLKIN